MLVVNAEGLNVHRRQDRSSRLCEDVEVHRSPQAMACRKRYVEEPRKSQRLLIRGEVMKLSELGHERVKSPETAWARMELWNIERSGRLAKAICRGVSYGAY